MAKKNSGKSEGNTRIVIETVGVDSLMCDPSNARTHGARNLDAIKASMAVNDQYQPLVVTKDNVVIIGNGRLEAARSLGWEFIDIVRTSLTGADAAAMAIMDNRSSELADWDTDTLAATLAALQSDESIDHLITGFTDAEIDALVSDSAGDVEVVEDEVPEPPADPITKPGDLWIMGGHRLLCGDSTNSKDVHHLMGDEKADIIITDPPYGVDYQGGATKRDRLEGDKTTCLYEPTLMFANQFSVDKAPVYLWHSDSKTLAVSEEVSEAVSEAGYERRCTIIWNKNTAQFGAFGAQYKTKHEPCYYLYKKGIPPNWYGPTTEITVWDIDRNSKNEHHPTEKPVRVMARPMENSSKPDDLVVDFFLGSGTTLIAAEQLGRKCYGIEISGGYCDVIVKRWENLTGETAVLEK